MSLCVAVVTGASSGIGKAFVEKLLAEEWTVYAFSRPSNHFSECVLEWNAGTRLTPCNGSICDQEAVQYLGSRIGQEHGYLDLLVNNAGVYVREDCGLPGVEALAESIETNLVGQYRMIRGLMPLLEGAARPIILNVSSGAGRFSTTASDGPLGYRVSKAGVNMLTLSLSLALKERNVVVHAADPGYVRTRLNPDGTDTPARAVEGMWHLTQLHDLESSGRLWWGRDVVEW